MLLDKRCYNCDVLTPILPKITLPTFIHTHTQTHIHIYICVCACVRANNDVKQEQYFQNKCTYFGAVAAVWMNIMWVTQPKFLLKCCYYGWPNKARFAISVSKTFMGHSIVRLRQDPLFRHVLCSMSQRDKNNFHKFHFVRSISICVHFEHNVRQKGVWMTVCL